MKPRFHPAADGLGFEASHMLSAVDYENLLQGSLRPARAGALDRLREGFGGAVDLHEVAAYLEHMPSEDLALGAGLVFCALDYWHAFANSPAGTTASPELAAYCRQRLSDFWEANSVALLEYLAVLRRIPEEWLPRDMLERQIENRLRSGGIATSVKVQIEFRFHVRGGAAWLRGRLAGEQQKVDEHLAADGVCPVVLFGEELASAVVAFAREGSILRCYDPLSPGEVRNIDTDGVPGMLCANYRPARPPVRKWQRLFLPPVIRRIIWLRVRAWRLRNVAH